MAPALPDEIVGEILLRLPPSEPEHLFRAALVCKPWLRTLCDAAFRRRYRVFHGAAPLLGLLHRREVLQGDPPARFASTTSVPDFPHPGADGRRTRPLDCRHGRVLIHMLEAEDEGVGYLVWDPITGERHALPEPDIDWLVYSAAVFCAVDGCDHLDCHGGPFRVVFAATHKTRATVFATAYSSDTGVWSAPVHFDDSFQAFVQQIYSIQGGTAMYSSYTPYLLPRRGTLIGDAVYFTLRHDNTIVKYDWNKNCLSMIKPPAHDVYDIALMAMEDSSLGFVCIQGSSLYLWAMKVDTEEAGEWEQRTVIELMTKKPAAKSVIKLKTKIPVANRFNRPNAKIPVANSGDIPIVVGSAEGVGIIFISTGAGLFTIKLNTRRVKKVGKSGVYFSVLPYMSFYTPDRGRLLSIARTH